MNGILDLNNIKSRSLIISLKTTKLDFKEKRILSHKNVGGVILFTRNFLDQKQLISLVSQIKEINNKIIVMVDHEGGKIWRFKNPAFYNPGPMQQLGDLYLSDPEKALARAYDIGYAIAVDLLNCGVDLNLAPVLDLQNRNKDGSYVSSIISGLGRSIHSDPRIVAVLAAKFIDGQKAAGMLSVGKHFPGHGSVDLDTHLTITEDPRSKQQIFNLDLEPFRLLIEGDSELKINPNTLSIIMPAHVIYSAVDPQPAGCSQIWLQEILRKQINFKGMIISDCLSMNAVQNFFQKEYDQVEINNIITRTGFRKQQAINLLITKKAFEAGCDLVIFNNLYDQDLLDLLNSI